MECNSKVKQTELARDQYKNGVFEVALLNISVKISEILIT